MSSNLFRSYPIISIAFGILALLFLMSIAHKLGNASVPIASILWIMSLIGLIYASGRFPRIDSYPSVRRFFMSYAPCLTNGADTEIEKQQIPDITKFVGMRSVIHKLEDFLNSRRMISRTAQPATMMLLVGKKGTGKSSVSLWLSEQLIKYEIVKGDFIKTISVDDTEHNIIRGIEDSLDGVLRIEDIDEVAKESQEQAVSIVGPRLQWTAQKFPGRLFVIFTGSAETVTYLRPYLIQFNVNKIEFPDLDDSALIEYFMGLLAEKELRLADEAAGGTTLKNMITELKSHDGNNFSNTYSIKNFFDHVNYQRGLRLSNNTLPVNQHNLVTSEDMRNAVYID
jgi:hypothetical protein